MRNGESRSKRVLFGVWSFQVAKKQWDLSCERLMSLRSWKWELDSVLQAPKWIVVLWTIKSSPGDVFKGKLSSVSPSCYLMSEFLIFSKPLLFTFKLNFLLSASSERISATSLTLVNSSSRDIPIFSMKLSLCCNLYVTFRQILLIAPYLQIYSAGFKHTV